jgi:glycosyltransferase involved in cell wall biosynthesis
MAELEAAIATSTPDVVHAHSSNAGFVARLVCRRLGVPCVYTAHGWPFQRGAAFSQRVASWAGEFVAGRVGDGVICLTDAEARRGRRACVIRRNRVWVVQNGLADVPDDLVRRHRRGTPAVIMVARFAPPKRQRELIDVFRTLSDIDWTLTFVGDGPQLENCRAHGAAVLGDRVAFLGYRDDVPELLPQYDIAVLWSAYEGLPLAMLEAMRAGLCCVAADLAGVRVLFDNGAGLTAGSADDLAAVLRKVITMPSDCAALGQAARTAFEDRYTIDAVERRLREVYEAVARGARPSLSTPER